MFPGAFGQAVVAGQRVRVRAHVGGALHVVVATENVGAAAGHADVAQCQLQDAGCANHGVADGVLGLAHAPDNGRWPVFGHHFSGHEDLRFRNAAGLFDLVRCPLGHHVFFDLFHAVNTVIDVLFVFPSVLEDVVQHAEQERNVRARADTDVVVGPGGGACEARINHDHLAAGFFGVQHVQHAHRVGFSGVRADVQRRLAVLHVVVGIGHGAVAPCVGHAGHSGRVADAGLVVGVVGAPEADELAHQIGLLVVVLGRADPVHRVRTAGLAQLEHACADFIERHVPADALVLAVNQLHGVAQAELTMAVLAQGRTFGAMRTQVDRGVKHRLLAHPDTVFNHGVHRTTHRAVRANGALDFELAAAVARFTGRRCVGFFDQRELGSRQAHADTHAGAAQKSAAVHGGQGIAQAPGKALHKTG